MGTVEVGSVVAVGIQVFDITDSAFALGLVGLAEFVPNLLLVPFTGALADRYDRKLVAGCGLALHALSAVGLALYATTDPTSTVPIFGLVMLFGCARALYGPATRAMPADLADAETLPALTARRSITWQVGQIAGPVAAGFLYAASPSLPYFVGAVLAATAVLVILQVPSPAEHAPGGHGGARAMMHEAAEGLRVVRGAPVLLGAISLDLFAVLFGGAVALIPAIAEERLGVGEIGIGWLRASVGIGAAITTLVLAVRPVTARVGKVMMLSVALFGVFTIVFGATTNFAVAFVALAGLSAADSVSVFVRTTLVPLVTPRHVRGRVLAVENVFVGASNELGAFESGVAASFLGTSLAVVTGGAMVLAVVGLWWRWFPVLPAVDRFTDLEPVDVVAAVEGTPRPV